MTTRVVLNCPFCKECAVLVEWREQVLRVAHAVPACTVYRQTPDAYSVLSLLRPYYAAELAFVPLGPAVVN